MIAGYKIFYLKSCPLNKMDLTLTSKIIPVELKESAEELIKNYGGGVLSESVINDWLVENGLTL